MGYRRARRIVKMAFRDRHSSSGSEGLFSGENESADDNFEDEEPEDPEEEDELDLALSAPPDDKWYHGMLDRETSQDRLFADGRGGCYLVRESDRKPGTYSLSYLGIHGVSHFRITAVCGDFYIGGRQFDSLSDLIGYYTKWSCLLKDERLVHPVPPPEPVMGRRRVIAKYIYNKTPDTDELSFCQGDVFVVDNEIENDWLWVTAQKNKERGLVPVALVEDADPNLDPYAGRPWFFGDVTKQAAQEILTKDGVIGSFLIRPSDKSPGDYSLSLKYESRDGITRFLIRRQEMQFLMGGRVFASLDAVVERYKHEHIVEGLSLIEPVPKMNHYDMAAKRTVPVDLHLPHRPSTPSRVMDQSDTAFPFHRQSSGIGIIHKKEKVHKRGYLVKQGHRNKWKRLFFLLDGREQHLYFFEHEKRTKPKGLIDLSFSMVYDVHESLFGRPNCFQVVLRALTESRMFYLCADTQDLANEWKDAIKMFCGKQSVTNGMAEKDVTQLRSLEVCLVEAHKLQPSKVSHPYCILSLNEVKTCRTKTQEGHLPIWNEDFKFNDLPADVSTIGVSLYNRNKRSKDVLIGCAAIPLNKLQKGQTVDDWYPLHSLSHTKIETDVGSIRVKSKYMHEIIMPLEEYEEIKKILTNLDLVAVVGLGDVCKDRVFLASTLLKIYRHERQEVELLRLMNEREVQSHSADEIPTLFRGTSLASTLMDQYMKMVAIPYLQTTIRDVVVKILECKQSCELNPTKLEKGADTVVNLKQLFEFLFDAVNAIFTSARTCPCSLRFLFGCLQQNVKERWADSETVRTRVISGFLFLRLICPAIMNPKLCNMMSESPSPTAARTLTLVAKCLQKLANLVEFGAMEPYMTPVNPFIQRHRDRMISFLDELSAINECPETTDPVSSDLARDLASVHDLCVAHEHELKQHSISQPSLKKLVAVTETLRQRELQFIKENLSL